MELIFSLPVYIIVVLYAFLGAAIKFIDQAYDEDRYSRKLADLLSVLAGLVMGVVPPPVTHGPHVEEGDLQGGPGCRGGRRLPAAAAGAPGQEQDGKEEQGHRDDP